MMQHVAWMKIAIQLAQRAEAMGEVPVGALLIHENQIVGQGWNQVITQHDPSAHAEIVALRDAGQQIKNYRLLNTTLYVTLEPCAMCIGAMIHARVSHVVFGAPDPKTGVLGGAVDMIDLPHWNHSIKHTGGILAEDCSNLLKNFFKRRR